LRAAELALAERPATAEPPLTVAEFDRALTAIGGFEPHPLIAIAVSGGPDSLALAILADRWSRMRGGAAWGLIVDHGLRPESGAEAETVAGWLAARGIPHAVLAWRGAKPATGIQEAARAARYELLAGWCAAQGCLHLLTAHHRDDQAETYLIRRRAQSGADGLAAMPSVRELPHVRLVRPLLDIPKVRLAAFLDSERQPYLRDPSNRNPVFERARLRLLQEAPHPNPLPACGEREGPGAQRWEGEGQPPELAGPPPELAAIRAHAVARVASERCLAALLAGAVALHPAGFAVLEPTPLAASGALGEQALGRVAAVIGGARYPLRRERLARLRETLAAQKPCAATLGGCRFVPWRDRVLVLRESARCAPPLTLAPGMTGMWDRRFTARLAAGAPAPVTIGALGDCGIVEFGRHIGADNPLPRLIYSVLPAIRDAAGLAAVPHLFWRRDPKALIPLLNFRPSVALFGAGFTVV
jgi:tRNA(Ile)-lysidine synthase